MPREEIEATVCYEVVSGPLGFGRRGRWTHVEHKRDESPNAREVLNREFAKVAKGAVANNDLQPGQLSEVKCVISAHVNNGKITTNGGNSKIAVTPTP